MEGRALTNWLNNKTNREKAAIAAPILIAVVGGGWTAYTFLFKPPTMSIEAKYHVCVAGERSYCSPQTTTFLDCRARKSISQWAVEECGKYTVIGSIIHGGGMCGIEEADIKCGTTK
jgi:hypothetical protein